MELIYCDVKVMQVLIPSCPNPAEYRALAGCRHEHIQSVHVCAPHIIPPVREQALCGPCYMADRHWCLIRFHKIEQIGEPAE